MELFDIIYCVNLKHRTDRREETAREAEKIGKKIEFIEAFDANKIEIQPLFLQRQQRYRTKEEWACTLSHFKALETFLASPYERCLIVEDDVSFRNDFKERTSGISFPKNADVLVLGWLSWPPTLEDCYPEGTMVRKAKFWSGLHCSIFTRQGAMKILSLKGMVNATYDDFVALQNLNGNITAYQVIPSLAGQRYSYSDLVHEVLERW